MVTARILVVEDDDAIGTGLYDALCGQGYEAQLSTCGAEALAAGAGNPPDLALIDLGLPDIDGVQLCRELRSVVPTAILVVLTARRDEVDIVLALEAGADDYLTKPFKLQELLARIRAHLRRAETLSAAAGLSAGSLVVDSDARRVVVDGDEVDFRAKEFDLLFALMDNAGSVVTRDALMTDVWDAHWHSSTKTIDMHMSSVRRKLAIAGWPGRIVTLRGVGYRLEPP